MGRRGPGTLRPGQGQAARFAPAERWGAVRPREPKQVLEQHLPALCAPFSHDPLEPQTGLCRRVSRKISGGTHSEQGTERKMRWRPCSAPGSTRTLISSWNAAACSFHLNSEQLLLHHLTGHDRRQYCKVRVWSLTPQYPTVSHVAFWRNQAQCNISCL